MAGCGSCGGRRTAPLGYVVKVPGQPERTVADETSAQAAVRGIRGATYRPKR